MTTYYRYIPDTRQSAQGHHVNPDMARWRQGQIDDVVAREDIAWDSQVMQLTPEEGLELVKAQKKWDH